MEKHDFQKKDSVTEIFNNMKAETPSFLEDSEKCINNITENSTLSTKFDNVSNKSDLGHSSKLDNIRYVVNDETEPILNKINNSIKKLMTFEFTLDDLKNSNEQTNLDKNSFSNDNSLNKNDKNGLNEDIFLGYDVINKVNDLNDATKNKSEWFDKQYSQIKINTSNTRTILSDNNRIIEKPQVISVKDNLSVKTNTLKLNNTESPSPAKQVTKKLDIKTDSKQSPSLTKQSLRQTKTELNNKPKLSTKPLKKNDKELINKEKPHSTKKPRKTELESNKQKILTNQLMKKPDKESMHNKNSPSTEQNSSDKLLGTKLKTEPNNNLNLISTNQAKKKSEIDLINKNITSVKQPTKKLEAESNKLNPSTSKHSLKNPEIELINIFSKQFEIRPNNKLYLAKRALKKPEVEIKQKLLTDFQKNKKNKQASNEINDKEIVSCVKDIKSLNELLNVINKAKAENKIFYCFKNAYIRKSLLNRGWIEKINVCGEDKSCSQVLEEMSFNSLIEGMKIKQNYQRYRKVLVSKLLENYPVDFHWDYSYRMISDNQKTLINRYPNINTYYHSNKAGLSESLQQSHWFYKEGISNVRYPRTYDLSTVHDLHNFIDYYRLTAAISLLQWIVKMSADKNLSDIKIPISVFNFALIQCHHYILFKEHVDIDTEVWNANDYEWNIFLERFYKIMQNHEFIDNNNMQTVKMLTIRSKQMLEDLKKYKPNLENDGFNNLWLLKPQIGSRGCGIVICNTLQNILEIVNTKIKHKYIVQKYIERPFLIYNTKFDIRQWFLISSLPELSVWIYRDCYLRFSSQQYNLNNLHESVHLTNNAIQSKYTNGKRDANLPSYNMWHCNTFKKHLQSIGLPKNTWKKIHKEMKEAMVCLMMSCQDKFKNRENSFELWGVDFMLSEDLNLYLIEVNSRPAIYASTPVTAQMCPQVLEDVVKVVVDNARDKDASTGLFELIYVNKHNVDCTDKDSLYIKGKSIFSDSINSFHYAPIKKEKVDKNLKRTLENMLEMIHSQTKQLNFKEMELRENMKNLVLNNKFKNYSSGR